MLAVTTVISIVHVTTRAKCTSSSACTAPYEDICLPSFIVMTRIYKNSTLLCTDYKYHPKKGQL